MLALRFVGLVEGPALWPLPLPIALLGVGLMLYYALASDARAVSRRRTRSRPTTWLVERCRESGR